LKPVAPFACWDLTTPGRREVAMELQYAALPYRKSPEGETQILLVTTRKRGRWILPKGRGERSRPAHAVAANEALEEAGISGDIQKNSIGTFYYRTIRRHRRRRVQVFRLRVRKHLKRWKEDRERRVLWLSPGKAARMVHHKGLKALLLQV